MSSSTNRARRRSSPARPRIARTARVFAARGTRSCCGAPARPAGSLKRGNRREWRAKATRGRADLATRAPPTLWSRRCATRAHSEILSIRGLRAHRPAMRLDAPALAMVDLNVRARPS